MWGSLISEHWLFKALGDCKARLLPSDVCAKTQLLKVVDANWIALTRRANKVLSADVRATYRICFPYYIDGTLSFRVYQ